ncbi:MAG: hypothetical protein AB8H47_09915 [Bacteroidia bacterium]
MVELSHFAERRRRLEEKMEELLADASDSIHYPGKYNDPQFFFPEEVEDFKQLESNVFPLEQASYSRKFEIFHEYYELLRYPATSLSQLHRVAHWKEEAMQDARFPQAEFIASRLILRLNTYQENFQVCLESVKKHDLFSLIEDKVALVKALVDYYNSIIADPTKQLKIFHRNYIVLNKDVSDLFCKGLITLLEEKIAYISVGSSTQIEDLATQSQPQIGNLEAMDLDSTPEIVNSISERETNRRQLTSKQTTILIHYLHRNGFVLGENNTTIGELFSQLTGYNREDLRKFGQKNVDQFLAEKGNQKEPYGNGLFLVQYLEEITQQIKKDIDELGYKSKMI